MLEKIVDTAIRISRLLIVSFAFIHLWYWLPENVTPNGESFKTKCDITGQRNRSTVKNVRTIVSDVTWGSYQNIMYFCFYNFLHPRMQATKQQNATGLELFLNIVLLYCVSLICLQTPIVFWLGGGIISSSYWIYIRSMMLGRQKYTQHNHCYLSQVPVRLGWLLKS
jgi:hypothetical protein